MDKPKNSSLDKLDHIAQMFNFRTAGKAYENFIVNAIYTKIGEPELMPVTQQYVKNPRDPRGYYLLDLYFPQLKYGVEVDESHHLGEAQKARDLVRAEDIRTAIECDEFRIPIYDTKGNKRSYEDVVVDIDKVVAIIKDKIAKDAPLKWLTYEERKAEILKKGVFSIKEEMTYPSITEIYNMCGGKRSGQNKGEARSLRKCYYRLNDRYKLWVPILAEIDKNGKVSNGKMGYENTLSEDFSQLIEKSSHPISSFDNDTKRIVFMRMRDYYGRQCIKFIGVFQLIDNSINKEYVRVYRRVADEVRIDELMP